MIGHAVIDPATQQVLATYDDHEAQILENVYDAHVHALLDDWERIAPAIRETTTSKRMCSVNSSLPLWCQNE